MVIDLQSERIRRQGGSETAPRYRIGDAVLCEADAGPTRPVYRIVKVSSHPRFGWRYLLISGVLQAWYPEDMLAPAPPRTDGAA